MGGNSSSSKPRKRLEDLTESELRAKAEADVDAIERILVLQEKDHAEARKHRDISLNKTRED